MAFKTPFWEFEKSEGATFVEFAGWLLPQQYSSVQGEVLAVREKAGFFDISHMTRFFISGKDSLKLLNLVFSRSVPDVGKAKYGFFISPEGKLVDDVIVYRIAEDKFFVVSNAGTRQNVFELLKFVSESKKLSVEIEETTFKTVFFAVQGPESPKYVQNILRTVEVDTISRFRFVWADGFFLSRTGYTGEDGFEVMLPSKYVEVVWDRVKASEITLCGLASRDILRLEAGFILFGKDLTSDDTPFGSFLERFVDNKKCLGYSLLRRHFDENPTWLSGIIFSGRRIPRAGMDVFDFSGAKIGFITSGVFSYTLSRPIAFARFFKSPDEGQKVYLVIRGGKLEGEIFSPPFLKLKR